MERPNGLCGLLLFMLLASAVNAAPIELLSAPAQSAAFRKAEVETSVRGQLSESFGRSPLVFEAVDDTGDQFLCRGSGYHLLLSPAQQVLTLRKTGPSPGPRNERIRGHGLENIHARSRVGRAEAVQLRITLVGGNVTARSDRLEPSSTKVNYFLGNDPKRWRTGVSTFGRVRYENVYPGIDLDYHGNQQRLEYDFSVAPGADLNRITLGFQPLDKIEIDSSGDLQIVVGGVPVRQHKPIVYQEIDGKVRVIDARYVIRDEAMTNAISNEYRIGFEVANYDTTKPLIIDPVLGYATFLGGVDVDHVWDIAVDANGSAYIVGDTLSTNFPTAGSFSSTNGGGIADVFLAKLGPEGTNLVYSTYLGGNGADVGLGIAVNSIGEVYLTGLTASTNFPVTSNAIATNLNSVAFFGFYTNDAFVVKFDASGTNLLYSTYLGGSAADTGVAIAVDANGGVYVAGDTFSSDFPTNSSSLVFGGLWDAFVLKFTPGNSNLDYSTYLGGSGIDLGQGISVNVQGEAIICGYTSSLNFPVTNAMQTNFGGGVYDAFVTKLSADGSTRIFSTYLGGTGDDAALRITVDDAGNAFATGLTSSTNFPTKSSFSQTNSGGEDAFVIKLDPSGTNLLYSTYLGGSFNDEGWSIAVDTNGSAYVVGLTGSTNFPTVRAVQSVSGGLNDAFVAKLSPDGTTLDYSTYLGGLSIDNGIAIALDGAGNAYIAGNTLSTNFPVLPTTNGLQTVYGGGTGDAFVAKLFSQDAELRAGVSGLGEVTIFWPADLLNFELQFTASLDGTNTVWQSVTNVPTIVGGDNSVMFSNPSGNVFFRLSRSQ